MLYKKNPSAYTRCEKCRHIDRENEECKVTNDKWLVCDNAGECRQFSQEGVNMKVRCINKVEGGTLEVGKIYDVEVVEAAGMTFYEFVNEENERCGHPAEYFEKVNDEKLDVDLSSKYHIHKEKLDKNPLEKYKKEISEKFEKLTEKPITAISNVNHPNHYNKGRFEVIEEFKNITGEMIDLYKIKNKNYGDSFSRQFKEYGLTSVCIRLEDKLNRIKSLKKQGSNVDVGDESLRDTLIDLANYSVMAIIEIDKGE